MALTSRGALMNMEPFYVEVEQLSRTRWKWSGWDAGGPAVAYGYSRTEARAHAAAREWMKHRFAERNAPSRTSDPDPSHDHDGTVNPPLPPRG